MVPTKWFAKSRKTRPTAWDVLGSWCIPCLPTNPWGLLVKQGGAGPFFKQQAGSIRRQKQPSLNQHLSVLPLGFDDVLLLPAGKKPLL